MIEDCLTYNSIVAFTYSRPVKASCIQTVVPPIRKSCVDLCVLECLRVEVRVLTIAERPGTQSATPVQVVKRGTICPLPEAGSGVLLEAHPDARRAISRLAAGHRQAYRRKI